MTPLPNVPTTFIESEKAKNKNCYQELFEDVEAKRGRTVKTQDFGSEKIILPFHYSKNPSLLLKSKKIFFCQKSRITTQNLFQTDDPKK
jgi:hypothetical protein